MFIPGAVGCVCLLKVPNQMLIMLRCAISASCYLSGTDCTIYSSCHRKANCQRPSSIFLLLSDLLHTHALLLIDFADVGPHSTFVHVRLRLSESNAYYYFVSFPTNAPLTHCSINSKHAELPPMDFSHLHRAHARICP